MTKLMFTVVLLAMTGLSAHVFAKAQDKPIDPYSQCVDETIQELKLGNINNAVVEICSTRAKTLYTKQIVQLLDQIKTQSKQYKQPERYNDIMKSQQLWKNFVDQECRNAGAYIGSPMYEFCPMQKYAERLEQLKEYLN
ncbi:lysozyme inhibitor LprI family protein [Acinetobacter proteolyticus]|uniref:lysozyme inhibitor LprI family protein n=1 Tax=Acinetobacter proteolyticus TaxID=1776741 RepID=UPI0031D44CF1